MHSGLIVPASIAAWSALTSCGAAAGSRWTRAFMGRPHGNGGGRIGARCAPQRNLPEGRGDLQSPRRRGRLVHSMEGEMAGALAGLRVIDLSGHLSGPFCAMQLADMGADVIKVEK